MVGIISYGAYVPMYRLSREAIGAAWAMPAPPGEKAVANFDEDSITMAVEAARDCVKDIDCSSIDGLYLATTTSPYKEKQASAVVAAALGLRRGILTIDFAGSLRAGSNAMRAALDAVKAGSARRVLVVAADCRLGIPRSEFEMNFGDGAAALLVGDENIAVSVECSYSHTNEFLDLWRTESDDFIRSWEDRFIIEHGYNENMMEAITGILKKCGLKNKDLAKVVLYGPDARSHSAIVRDLGFDVKSQVQDPMFSTMGNTGTAFCLMMLVAALEGARVGDKVLLASYADGCDAYILQVKEAIEKIRDRRGIKVHLAHKRMLPGYGKYVRFRKLMSGEAARRPPEVSSATVLWRDRSQVLSLHGSKCLRCGTPQFPIQRVCTVCFAKDEYKEYNFSDKNGKVYTYTIDYLASSENPPMVKAVVDFEGGGRMFCQMADCDPDNVKVGMPVEMVFRKIYDAAGFHNYFWKFRPAIR